MPNWCLNEVAFYFEDVETQREFVKSIEGTREETQWTGPDPSDQIVQRVPCVIVFNEIIPQPPEDERGEDWDWYSWRIDNWGTKWEPDIIHFDVSLDGCAVTLEMYTAWSPPEGIYKKLMEDWEDRGMSCSWFYREDGMQIAGWLPN